MFSNIDDVATSSRKQLQEVILGYGALAAIIETIIPVPSHLRKPLSMSVWYWKTPNTRGDGEFRDIATNYFSYAGKITVILWTTEAFSFC